MIVRTQRATKRHFYSMPEHATGRITILTAHPPLPADMPSLLTQQTMGCWSAAWADGRFSQEMQLQLGVDPHRCKMVLRYSRSRGSSLSNSSSSRTTKVWSMYFFAVLASVSLETT